MNKLINIKTGGRESKFELLRLLSMLMVLNLHSFHGYDYGSGIMQGLIGLGRALPFVRLMCLS